MPDITPKDAVENKALGFGQRIAAAIGIIGAAVPAMLAAFGGADWITAHLPLLLTGLGSLATGGIASYIAVRRMRVDRLAKGAGLAIMLLTAFAITGCVAIRADSDGDGAAVWAFGWGADSAAQLANVAVTGPSTNDSTGVSFDSANTQQQTQQAIQSLVSLGAALAPILAGKAPAAIAATSGAASAPSAATEASATDDADSSAADSTDAADPDGYSGSPGPSGEGVYGRPSCSRCRAYKTAHPDIDMINIDTAANRSDLWAALRLRGYTGSSISLPVSVTATSYTQAAK